MILNSESKLNVTLSNTNRNEIRRSKFCLELLEHLGLVSSHTANELVTQPLAHACTHARTHGNAQVVAAGRQGAPEERLKPEDQTNVEIQTFDEVT